MQSSSRNIFQSLFLLFTVFTVNGIPQNTVINGLIEGFYWTDSNSVKGQAYYYSKQQRDDLISTMQNGLNYYFFCPHETGNTTFTINLWTAQEMSQWSDTIARASNVSIVFGLRPKWIENVDNTLNVIKLKLAQLVAAKARYYILCWDDSPGAGTDTQMERQRDLIMALMNQVTNIELIGVIPAYYSRSQISGSTSVDWGNKLALLNQVSTNVRFFVTGLTTNPSSIQTTDVPTLTNRQFIFFDNWIAVDSNSRVTMTWPPNRNVNIYRSSSTVSGSVMNLAFPPERIIHQIYALKQRVNNTYSNINAHSASQYWANYLVTKQFYENPSLQKLRTSLSSLINAGYEMNIDIIQNYPSLSQIFTN